MTSINSLSTLQQAKTFLANFTNEELRCLQCNKLLAKINTNGILACQIKCPRCREINEV